MIAHDSPSFEASARLLIRTRTRVTLAATSRVSRLAWTGSLTAIIALGREPGGGLVVMGHAFTGAHRAPIILTAARNNVPAVYWLSAFPRDGGLLSYGVDEVDPFRRAATYVDRILRGAKPGDLPVQLPTKFEMVVNLKTAKALGLTVPQSIVLRAEEVIE